MATWDRHYGDSAPLLSWPEIRTLRDEGVEVISHGAAHLLLTSLSPRELHIEGVRSREVMERELGRAVNAIAYPYGDVDGVVGHVMRGCGFDCGLTYGTGLSQVHDDPMAIPRIEVSGFDDLDIFVGKLGSTTRRGSIRRTLSELRSLPDRLRG